MKIEIKGKSIAQTLEIFISFFTIVIGIMLIPHFMKSADNFIDGVMLVFSCSYPIMLCGYLLHLRVLEEGYYEEFKKEQEEAVKKK